MRYPRQLLLAALILAPLVSCSAVVAVTPLLVAGFTYEVHADRVNFTDISDGYNIVKWSWSFGDGSISFEQNPVHEYKEIGNYSVTLEVTDVNGGKATHYELIKVTTVPEVNYTLYYAAFGLTIVGLILVAASRNHALRIGFAFMVVIGLVLLLVVVG